MKLKNKKITLIGMPSSGKTTIGEFLSKKIGYEFLDLDIMVEEKEGKSLIEVMNEKGADYFRNMEYDFLREIKEDQNVVISPAGSIIFQEQALDWIMQNTFVIFLDTPLDIIETRLREQPKAVAGLKERGLLSIWEERQPLYLKSADETVDTKDKNVFDVVNDILLKITE